MSFGEQTAFELGPTQREPITEAALVCLLPGRCPSCGGPLMTTKTWQPALFIGCGYGGATATTVKRCQGCGWWIATGQETVNPRVFT